MECVILAAGEGRRMRPLTARRPKVMLPVAGKPLLEHLLVRAREAGFRDFTVVTHYQAHEVRRHFRDGKAWKIRIRYVDQGEAAGTGHAVARLARRFKRPFALFYGDSLFAARDLAGFHESDGLKVGAARVRDASDYGRLEIRRGRLAALDEKPRAGGAGWVNTGSYVLTPDLARRCLALKPSRRGELELTDALKAAVRDGDEVRAVACPSWRDAGRPWHLLDLQAELLAGLAPRRDGLVERGAHLEGPVAVEKGARVRTGVVIEGPCLVQREARIGPNAYLRAATTVGPGCHVGAAVEIKNSILMEGARVPHLSYLGDSILGRDVNLGAGTTVANLKHSLRTVRVRSEDGKWIDTGRRKFGAILGDGVKTGINTSINCGAVLGAGAWVLPGRVVDGWVPAGTTVS